MIILLNMLSLNWQWWQVKTVWWREIFLHGRNSFIPLLILAMWSEFVKEYIGIKHSAHPAFFHCLIIWIIRKFSIKECAPCTTHTYTHTQSSTKILLYVCNTKRKNDKDLAVSLKQKIALLLTAAPSQNSYFPRNNSKMDAESMQRRPTALEVERSGFKFPALSLLSSMNVSY